MTEELCEDEGCPHHAIEHICIEKSTSVSADGRVKVCPDGREFLRELAETMGVIDVCGDEDESYPIKEVMAKMLVRARKDRERWHTPTPVSVTDGWRKITDERARQISAEGWDVAHDDNHEANQMLHAAMCYLEIHRNGIPMRRSLSGKSIPVSWPWETHWWKPKGRERDLVRSGALMLAERDRCVRLNRPHSHVDHKLNILLNMLSASPTPPAGAAEIAPNGRTWKEMCGVAEERAEDALERAEAEARRRVDAETQRDVCEQLIVSLRITHQGVSRDAVIEDALTAIRQSAKAWREVGGNARAGLLEFSCDEIERALKSTPSPHTELPAMVAAQEGEDALRDEISEIIANNVTTEEWFAQKTWHSCVTDCGPAAKEIMRHLCLYSSVTDEMIDAAMEAMEKSPSGNRRERFAVALTAALRRFRPSPAPKDETK